MSNHQGITIYSQDRLTDGEFAEQFVARLDELSHIVDGLRASKNSNDFQHSIIIGARGMGKSSLLRRISIEIQQDTELSKHLIPLSFREEQYNVISLDAFWRNCGEALAEWCDTHNKIELANEIDKAVEDPDWRDPDFAERSFLNFCALLDRRPLLLLDNLDIIIDGLRDLDCWSLRRALQADDGPIVIGGATRSLSQAGNRKAPFYEFFHPHYLEPLTETELLTCIYAIADRRGEAGRHVRLVLASEPGRIRTLYALTGGNPRVLALIYQILERAESDSIFSDLEVLLDQVTPFYKARVEEYQTPQQRAVIDAIALNWDPINSRSISNVTGIEITTISSHLNRLKRDGFIEEVASSTARSNYQLAERFLNIWYLMRHGTRRNRQRLKWLALFLVRLFTPDQLRIMAEEVRELGPKGRWHLDYREAVLAAYDLLGTDATLAEGRSADDQSLAVIVDYGPKSPQQTLTSWLQGAEQEARSGNYELSLTLLDQALGMLRTSEIGNDESVALILNNRVVTLYRLAHYEKAIVAADEFFEEFKDHESPDVQDSIARSLNIKALSYSTAGMAEQAIDIYDRNIARFAMLDLPDLRHMLARAWMNKGKLQRDIKDYSSSILSYREVVNQFANSNDLASRIVAAQAWFNLGYTHRENGELDQAVKVWDELVATYGPAPEEELGGPVARALLNKADMYSQDGRRDEALLIYDDVIKRFGSAEYEELQEAVLRTLISKSGALGELGRPQEVIDVTDKVIELLDSSNVGKDRLIEASALTNRSIAFSQLGRDSQALEVCEQIIAKFHVDAEPEIRELVFGAFFSKSDSLQSRNETEASIAVLDQVLDKLDVNNNPADLTLRAFAMFNKGKVLFSAERYDESLSVNKQLLAELGGDGTDIPLETVAMATFNKAAALVKLGGLEEALDSFERVTDLYRASGSKALQGIAASALVGQGEVDLRLNQAGEALEKFQQVVTWLEGSEDVDSVETFSRALSHMGRTLRELDRIPEAIDAYEVIIGRRLETSAASSEIFVEGAYVSIGNMYLDLVGDSRAAHTVYSRGLKNLPASAVLKVNLAWALLLQGKVDQVDISQLAIEESELEPEGLSLLIAGIEMAKGDVSTALRNLKDALEYGVEYDSSSYFDDLLRLLRLVAGYRHGEDLIEWFRISGYQEKYAPLYQAFVAYIHGEKFLSDVSPEVRRPARRLYETLIKTNGRAKVFAPTDRGTPGGRSYGSRGRGGRTSS